jgi:energy-coupling factor transporter ATP-binding protein EcfA2
MIKYIKLFGEFHEFVASIANTLTDDYEKKLVYLIIAHFDEIAEAGTTQGQRGKLLNKLIQEEGASAPVDLQTFEQGEGQKVFPFHELSSLDIEHFRGFSNKESIPFDKRFTFVYGPNGSGKSSFCEALEYAMLGYINEAITRRVDINEYIKNSFTGIGKPPILTAMTKAGETIVVNPDPSLYTFCFIEKNRIDFFGRISANTPNAKQSLLASLFGLSEFNDFVGNFTKNIEGYIDIIGCKQQELAEKSKGFEVHQENLKKSKEQLELLEKTKGQLGVDLDPPLSFDQLKPYLYGSEDHEGRLSNVDKLLAEKALKPITVLSTAEIDKLVSVLCNIAEETRKLLAEYESKRDRVSFRELYDAAVRLEPYSADKCPLCETPIGQTALHPFKNAKVKLQGLSDMATLEKRIETRKTSLRSSIMTIGNHLDSRSKACEILSLQYSGPDVSVAAEASDFNVRELITSSEAIVSTWQKLRSKQLEIDSHIKEYNLKAEQVETQRISLEKEQVKLRNLSQQVIELKTKIESESQNVSKYTQEIDDFKAKNANLIRQVQAEQPTVVQNKQFVIAYNSFLTRLTKYKDDLPIKHIKELNSLTLNIYNVINADDRHFEKASSIVLPASIEDPIRIAFADKPEAEFDVLRVLSEGHLRCLGLAILLAKNIHADCPVVVFDDVVNAVDDDHRGGVRQVIFINPELSAKQVVLTTHAEQFVNELEQHFSKPDYDVLVRKLSFTLDQNERLIRIKHDSQLNYLHRIGEACNDANWSEALYNCRCCLECLSHKLWRRLSNKEFKTEFAVVIRSPNGIPDLMTVITSMNKFLKKIDKANEYTKITEIFDYLIGLSSKSTIIWNYLNKGTHVEEGRSEFDSSIVKEIAGKLLELDGFVKA